MMKKLAIIGGGYMAGIFAKNANEMNIETHCFSLKDGITNPDLFDYIHCVNILDKDSVLEECQKLKIDGIVATTELTIATTSYVANKMKLIGLDYSVSKVITNKYRNRLLTSNVDGLFHPKFSEVNSIEEIIKNDFDFPIILKPTSKGGKRGITVVKDINHLEEAFEYALKESNRELPLLVEEYIDGGMECSVESLSFNGKNFIIQVTEKVTSGAPHCVELEHHQPANVSIDLRKKIEEVIDRALTCIGLTNGPCHTEIKIKNGKIYLIEFNARPGGDHISYPLVQLSTGYEYIKGAINIALNDFTGIDKSKFRNNYSGVMFVVEQTKYLLPLFKICENKTWCYKKNKVSDTLQSIVHNNGANLNYIIYCSAEKPNFEEDL